MIDENHLVQPRFPFCLTLTSLVRLSEKLPLVNLINNYSKINCLLRRRFAWWTVLFPVLFFSFRFIFASSKWRINPSKDPILSNALGSTSFLKLAVPLPLPQPPEVQKKGDTKVVFLPTFFGSSWIAFGRRLIWIPSVKKIHPPTNSWARVQRT